MKISQNDPSSNQRAENLKCQIKHNLQGKPLSPQTNNAIVSRFCLKKIRQLSHEELEQNFIVKTELFWLWRVLRYGNFADIIQLADKSETDDSECKNQTVKALLKPA